MAALEAVVATGIKSNERNNSSKNYFMDKTLNIYHEVTHVHTCIICMCVFMSLTIEELVIIGIAAVERY